MKKILFLFVVIACCSNLLRAQTIEEADSITPSESVLITPKESVNDHEFSKPIPRKISADSMHVLKQQKAFAYMEYIDSFFRNHSYPKEEIDKEAGESEKTGSAYPALRVLYWLLAFAAVGWVLWRLFFGSRSVFTRNKKLIINDDDNATETNTDAPIESLIDMAILDKNYRLATRYLYLQTLSLLGQKELLMLTPQKTNYQYVQELKGKAQESIFAKLTLQYEYAWYGGFKLSATQFEKIHSDFQYFIRINN